jgi:diacylglycerol kinase family enzyme
VARYLLVGNPTAQSGKNQERIGEALRALDAAGMEAELLATLPDRRTIAAVRDALTRAPGKKAVIAMGGDGTFREVAAGLFTSPAREEVALAMLPTGTANDQGKSFGIDASARALQANVEVIRNGYETQLDVGLFKSGSPEAPEEVFFDSIGWGLSARVLAQRNKDRAIVEGLGLLKGLYRDHAVYAGAFLKTFLESYVVPDKMTVRARLDDGELELDGLTDLVVKNTRIYAGAWVLDRASKHDDGLFEMIPFRGKRDWASKAIIGLDGNPLTEELLNEVGIEHSRSWRSSSFELELFGPQEGAPLAAQVDGEEWPAESRVWIDVHPRGLRLIVPQGL